MTYKNYDNDQLTSKDDDQKQTYRCQNCKSNNENKNKWTKLCDLLIYPISKIVEITKVRFDGHIYIELKLPFLSCSIKFCLTTLWIILFMIYNKI